MLLLVVSSCQQEIVRYNNQDNVYFDYGANGNDTLQVYTFCYTPERTEDTVYFSIKLSGERKPFDRQFNVEVDSHHTTAVVGLHYKPLDEFYLLRADSTLSIVPVIIYNKDLGLENAPVQLSLMLSPTRDLGTSFSALDLSAVTISNRLEEPDWWNAWSDILGDYSRVKHALYLIAVGKIDLIPDTNADTQGQIPYCLFILDKYRQFLNDPFTWQQLNAQQYVLTKHPDGNVYDFYDVANPLKIYTLKLNDSDGKYYFIDENNAQVTLN